MQLKNLFVSLLAIGSAVAAANPAANYNGVEARDDAGHVEARDKTCPQGMYFSQSSKRCICSPGYEWSGKSCKSICGNDSSAYWSSSQKSCVCKNSSLKFNKSRRECECDSGKQWDAYKRRCVESCGGGATMRGGKCSCSQSGQTYDSNSRRCVSSCKDGSVWSNGRCQCSRSDHEYNTSTKKCTLSCKDGAYVKNGRCACRQPGFEYDNSSRRCVSSCKDGAKWNNGRCQCSRSDHEYNTSTKKCTLSCKDGAYMKNGKCACRQPGFDYDNSSRRCVSSCKDGAKWNNGRCQCKPGYEYSGSKCVISCGSEGKLEKGSCVCRDSSKRFDTTTKKCVKSCGPDAHYDSRSNQCACDEKAKTWSNGVCACGKDEIFKKGECVPDCGTSAWWNSGPERCICHDKGKTYDKSKGGCGCHGDDEKYDASRKACVKNCGLEASWKKNSCVCYKGGQSYDSVSKSCSCEEGYTLIGKRCERKCPRNSKFVKAEGANKETCSCDKDEFQYNKEENACEPRCDKRIAYWSGNSCRCHNQEHIFENGSCGCPKGSTPSGRKCNPECKDGAKWSRKGCVCEAPNTKYTDRGCECKEGFTTDGESDTCVSKCPKSAYWEDNECKCRNSQFKFYPEEDGGKGACRCADGNVAHGSNGRSCKTDCGKYADFNSKSGKCECLKKHTVFVKNDEECACEEGYKLNSLKECRPACPSGSDFVPASGDKEATCECRGSALVYDKDLDRCVPRCPKSADWVKASGDAEGKCVCKSSSDKFENSRCSPKCPNDASYVPSAGDSPETCSCKSDRKKWDGEKCVNRCPRGTDPVKVDDSSEEICQCRDESKKLKDGSCVSKCPGDSTFVPKKGDTDETCKCTNGNFKYLDGECKCPEDTVQKGNWCQPLCGTKASWRDKQCRCHDTNADFVSDGKRCVCKTGFKDDEDGNCVSECPKDADYVPAKGDQPATCECQNKHLEYREKACKCPPNTEPVGKWCKPICAEGASLDNSKRPAECKCKVEGASVKGEGSDAACACPEDKPRIFRDKCVACPVGSTVSSDKKSCVCEIGKFNFSRNLCLCDTGRAPENNRCPTDCGPFAKENDKFICECHVKNAIFEDKKCECPTGAKKQQVRTRSSRGSWECVCDQSKLQGSKISSDGKSCVCPENEEPNAAGTKCVPRCTGSLELNEAEDECVCNPDTHFKQGSDCIKRCHPKTVKPVVDLDKREPQPDNCYCDPASYDEVSDEKCLPKCDDNQERNDEDECVCNLNTHGGEDCLPICGTDAITPIPKRDASETCFCNPVTHDQVSPGICVEKCTGELEHNPDEEYKCHCNPATHGEITVGGEKKCVENCVRPTAGGSNGETKRGAPTTECFCDTSKGYKEPSPGICRDECPVSGQKFNPDEDYSCWCDPKSHHKGTNGDGDETCTPICTDGEDSADCYCDEKTHKDDDGVCKPLCEAGDELGDCYCSGAASPALEEAHGHCVPKCNKDNYEHKDTTPFDCYCPNTHYDDTDNGKCLPFCQPDDEIVVDGVKKCHCKTTGENALKESGGYCVSPCTTEGETHDTASPPRCECKSPKVKDTTNNGKCLSRCSEGDRFKGGQTDCLCDEGSGTQGGFEKLEGDICRKKCGNLEIRGPGGLCQCQPKAFRPGGSGSQDCRCPNGAKDSSGTCVCMKTGPGQQNNPDPKKEVVEKRAGDPKCEDVCEHKASRSLEGDTKGDCVCAGTSDKRRYVAKTCKCTSGWTYRDGDCKQEGCPYSNTEYNEAEATCDCYAYTSSFPPKWRPDPSKRWSPTADNGRGACVPK